MSSLTLQPRLFASKLVKYTSRFTSGNASTYIRTKSDLKISRVYNFLDLRSIPRAHDLMVGRFRPIRAWEKDDSSEANPSHKQYYMENLTKEQSHPLVKFEECSRLPPLKKEEIATLQNLRMHKTAHHENLFMGFLDNNNSDFSHLKQLRFLIKVFPQTQKALALREFVAPHVGAIFDRGRNFLPTSICMVENGNPNSGFAVVRPYYKGHPATIWANDPDKYNEIPTDRLLELMALKYVAMGDADGMNPSNILQGENSIYSQKIEDVVGCIDNETTFPNEVIMRHLIEFGKIFDRRDEEETGQKVSSKPIWKTDDLIIGTIPWAQQRTEKLGGPEALLEYEADLEYPSRISSDLPNPIGILLNWRYSSKEIGDLEISSSFLRESFLQKLPEALSLCFASGIFTEEEIVEESTTLQHFAKEITPLLESNKAITYRMLRTGFYN